MKKTVSVIIAAIMLLTMCTALTGCASGKTTVGICQLLPHPALDLATQGFKDAVIAGLGEENVEFIEQNAQGDSTACTTIVNDFVTKKVDLILANATAALQAAANGTASIPVIGTSITEYGAALGIENFNGTVGTNVSGASDLAPMDEQAAIITTLFPETKTVGLLYCSSEANSAYQVNVMNEMLSAQGITCTEFPFTDSNDISAVATAAAAASDVIYIPTDNTAASCAEAINAAVLPSKTPIIGGDTTGICAGCGVATLSVDYYDLGVLSGEMAVKVLKGEAKIEEMAVQYSPKFDKVYNPTICAELGLDIAALEAAGFVALS